MATNPSRVESKLGDIISAWTSLRPTKSFANMTLDQFKARVKASIDARNAIDDLDNQMTQALDQRDKADVLTNPILLLVVNAVKGDPDEGEDGELYEAMGYVRKSERKSGLTRKKTTPPPAK